MIDIVEALPPCPVHPTVNKTAGYLRLDPKHRSLALACNSQAGQVGLLKTNLSTLHRYHLLKSGLGIFLRDGILLNFLLG